MIESNRADSGGTAEVAAVLAAAILRLHIRAAIAPANSETADLEVSDETVLSVHDG